MPDTYSHYAYELGLGHSGLDAYVLVEHLRSLGVEFDVFQTALDMSSTAFRLFLAAEKATMRAYDKPVSHRYRLIEALLSLLRQHNLAHPSYVYFTLGPCDRDRLLDWLDTLEGEKLKMLGAFGLSDLADVLPKDTSLEAYAKPLLDEMVAIIKERVKVTVISKGRVIAMAQATGGAGQPLEVRRYKGGTEADGVTLGECKLHKSGLMIIKKAGGNIPPAEKVTEIKNELTGHIVKLTATQDTTPEGEERAVKTVAHDATLTLTGKDHKKSWVVSVEDAPEPGETDDA